MNSEVEAGTYASLNRWSTPNSVPAPLRSVDTSVPTKGSQIPGEVLAIVLEYLCSHSVDDSDDDDKRPSQSKLAQCSLTCRHWAAHIRPIIFSRITLTSGKRAHAFSALVCSPINVPAPLRETIRYLDITMDDIERPWLFHVGVLFRGAGLPNLEWVDLTIVGATSDEKPQVARTNGELLLDVGLPRKLPFPHPIRLRTLRLWNLQFRSHQSLLRSLGLHSPRNIRCENVQWPTESSVMVPAGHLRRQLNLHTPEKIYVEQCAAVFPFIWSLVTPHLPSPGAIHQLLHIDEISTVMSIFRLFSDECECSRCEKEGREEQYELKVYPGARTYRSPINPAYPR